jgi:bacteriorhodopsin
MSRQVLGYVFFGIGFAAMVFVLIRTYYRLWKLRKEQGYVRKRLPNEGPNHKDPDHP